MVRCGRCRRACGARLWRLLCERFRWVNPPNSEKASGCSTCNRVVISKTLIKFSLSLKTSRKKHATFYEDYDKKHFRYYINEIKIV